MKIRQLFVVANVVFALGTFAHADEILVENTDPYTALSRVQKRLEGKGVYEPKISATELAKRERQDVENNREVLAQLRLLWKESEQATPTVGKGFRPMGHMREFARLLNRESRVRLADGNAVGAMQSKLDSYRIAVIVSRGGMLMDNLVGMAIESIGWSDVEKVGSKLDGKTSLEFFNSIENLRKQKPTYISILENEKAYSLAEFQKAFNSPDWKIFTTYKKGSLFSRTETEELATLSSAQIEKNITTTYEKAIERVRKPLVPIAKSEGEAADAYSRLIVSSATGPQARFLYEKQDTNTRLIEVALLFRAYKQGAISSEEFKRLLPTDPFGDGSLQEKDGVIYSVGPDGKNDGGRPTKNTSYYFDPKTGRQAKYTYRSPQLDSKGDIIAPNFVTTP